jgi:hypothetical protein
MNGLSLEMSEYAPIWNDNQRAAKCIAIAADFMGRCAARFGIAVPEQHWTFNFASGANRHDCPNMLRHRTVNGRPAWDVYVDLWNAAKADELSRMAGTPKPPVYALPELPVWWAKALAQHHPSDAEVDGIRWHVMRRRFEALRNVQRYSKPDTGSPKAGPKIEVHGKVNVERMFVAPVVSNGQTKNRTWFVEDTGCFLTAAAFTPNVTIKAR